MRHPPTPRAADPDRPGPSPTSRAPTDVLGTTLLLAGGFLAAVVAALFPAVVVVAALTALLGRPAIRVLDALKRGRRRRREACVGGTGACVEV